MPGTMSVKEAARKIEVTANEANLNHDGRTGCSAAESNLVEDLMALQKDPERLHAIRAQFFWDNIKSTFNGLPAVQIVDAPNHSLVLEINSRLEIESSGRVYLTRTPDSKAVEWALQNFDELDKNKDGLLTSDEISASHSGLPSVESLPAYGHVIDSQTSSGLSVGYSNFNFGSFYKPSLGVHEESTKTDTYGINKTELKSLYYASRVVQCNPR